MGLITKEVEVRLGGSNISYYENLGYEIPRHICKGSYKPTVKPGTTIMVRVEDLSKGSNALVDIEYDCCNKTRKMQYSAYHTRNHDGKIYCHDCACSVLHSGENNHKWNPNKTYEERMINREYTEYHNFVKRVLERDKYTCKCCGKSINRDAEVHHLDGYDWCVERRTDDTNGVTLCKSCHLNFHVKYGRGNNTQEQFEEWIGYSIEKLDVYEGELPTAKKIFDYEDNKIYDSAEQCSKVYGVTPTAIYNCCNRKTSIIKRKKKDGTVVQREERTFTVKGHHLFWLEEYEKMSQEEMLCFLESLKNKRYSKIICITTGEVFDRMIQAAKKYNVNKNSISRCCKHEQKTAGKLQDGTPLQWMYYEEYLMMIENGNDIKISHNKKYKQVVCFTTGEIFDKVISGAKKYNLFPGEISACCKGKRKTTGKLPDGTKLQWMYYEDFLKLPIEEQNEILARNKDSST